MSGLMFIVYGMGDYVWFLNIDGLDEAIMGVLDVSTFTAGTYYPGGYFPCGFPVRICLS